MKAAVILFLMFFTSPPAKPGKQVWTLNSTTNFQFNSMPACVTFGKHIWANFSPNPKIASTMTTTLRGWCVDQDTGESTQDKLPGVTLFEIGPGPQQ